MKYIEAERLKAEIKKRIKELDRDKYISVDSKTTRIAELHFIDRCTDSLQQEQPECGSSEKPNNPAEWSEEDKAFLKVAIAICNRYSHKDIADWLKSLRSRPKPSDSWKPRKEQMSCKWLRNGEECGKGLSGTPCIVKGCVAWEEYKEE